MKAMVEEVGGALDLAWYGRRAGNLGAEVMRLADSRAVDAANSPSGRPPRISRSRETRSDPRPFYRVADARDRQTGGTGIGLAITAQAVRLHNGTVTAANDLEGGLVVTIVLPVCAA